MFSNAVFVELYYQLKVQFVRFRRIYWQNNAEIEYNTHMCVFINV